jgi:hypothetical protein
MSKKFTLSADAKHILNKLTDLWTDTATDQISNLIQSFKKKILDRISQQLLNKTQTSGRMDVLPEGTRFIFTNPYSIVLVIEEKPQIRTIEASYDYEDKRIRLSFPYCIFIINWLMNIPGKEPQFNCLKFAVRSEPLRSIKDTIYFSWLPNIADRSSFDPLTVCLGTGTADVYKWVSTQPLAVQAEKIIGHFWMSAFEAYNNEQKIKKWAKDTEIDPALILKAKLASAGPLEKHIKSLIEISIDNQSLMQDLDVFYNSAWGKINLTSINTITQIENLIEQVVKEKLARIIEEIDSIKVGTHKKSAKSALLKALGEEI